MAALAPSRACPSIHSTASTSSDPSHPYPQLGYPHAHPHALPHPYVTNAVSGSYYPSTSTFSSGRPSTFSSGRPPVSMHGSTSSWSMTGVAAALPPAAGPPAAAQPLAQAYSHPPPPPQQAAAPPHASTHPAATAPARSVGAKPVGDATNARPAASTRSSTTTTTQQQQQQRHPSKEEPRKVRFSVGTKYAVQDVIGEGAYGVVASAIHRPTGQKVAIKKIAPFDHSMFALRTLRELKLLRYFAEQRVSENIISIVDIIKPAAGIDSFKEVYLIQELMETDLYRVIKTQTLSDDHVQYFVYQTLRALKALHSADVIHRDLKPSNLLLNANCDLKVCDFGLARSVATAEPNGGETGFMTEYVATRWYRAPEIMLTFKQYTKAIDIWSVGCICAEMLNGRPLFPGRDYHNQLSLILAVTGTPTLEEFYKITSRRSRDYLRALPFQKKRDFSDLFPNASLSAVDFLTKTLTLDPTKRLTVEECLEHPYVAAYHDPEDEPTAPPLPADFFSFDLQKEAISKTQLKELLFDEVMAFQPLV
ncbi:hypothetical protein JCM10212_001191 [Sporobolomyces blumeae]